MSDFFNKTNFAQFCGVTQAAISKAIKAGRLKVSDKDGTFGLIDAEHPQNVEYRTRAVARARKKEKGKALYEKDKREAEKREQDLRERQDPEIAKLLQQKEQAEIRKVIAQAQLQEAKTAAYYDKLIDWDIVKRAFGELYSVSENQILSIGARCAATIVSTMGITDIKTKQKIQQIIDKEASRALQGIKKVTSKRLRNKKE